MAVTGELVQREAELERIDAALANARESRGRALLIEGPAGIGKTTLLAAARRSAERAGMLVLAGRGTELERGYALGVVRQCLAPVMHAGPAAGREQLLTGAAALAAPGLLDGKREDPPTAPFGMLHGLYWLVANVTAQRPALLIVDDAQWADEPSLRFVAFLVRRVESLPVAVLVASRVPQDGGDQSPLWQARTDPAMEVLQPRPLGEDGVAALAALEAGAASSAVATLTGAGLLEDALPPCFRHPLLRGAVIASMSATEREAIHRHAAELLGEHGANYERRALHLLAVEPRGSAEAVATLRTAARQARHRGGPEPAIAMLTRALAEPPPADERYEVLLELAAAEHAAGRGEAASGHAAEAHELAPDTAARAAALTLWTTARMPDLSATAALAPLIDRALAELTDDDPELALHLRALALFAMLGDPDPDPDRMATVARDVALLRGDTVGEARVLAVHVFQRARSGTAEEIGGLAERAARQAHALDAAGADMESGGVVMGLRWADRLEAAERVLLDAIALARRQGSGPHFAFASMNLSEVRRRRGMLREAEADARAGIAAGSGWTAVLPAGALAACLLDQGRVAEAWEALVTGGLSGPIGPAPPFTEMLMVRMRVRAAAGERALAVADWHEALGRPIQGTPAASWIENQLVVADVLRAGADVSAARRLAADALDAARHWGTPGAVGEALLGVARVDDAADTVEVLREAVDLLERSPARLVHAQALVDLGAALRRRGDRREGRGPLREGLVLAEGCDADGLAERARRELAASGVRVQRQARGAAGLLTASERRVADLAIAGASNAEIAQGLFVSLKTVEMHLTSAYRKLGIAKRTELERALG